MDEQRPPKIFVTGPPGVGKTTVIMRTLEVLRPAKVRGFYTSEVRERGSRIGFDAVGLSTGRTVPLARRGAPGRLRVGRYSVLLEAFERLLQAELEREPAPGELVVIDEVGKMECFSTRFCAVIERILTLRVPILGTVAQRLGGVARRIREHPDCTVVAVTVQNRDQLPEELAEQLRGSARRSNG